MTKREALLAMGYRECKPGVWLKPIGYHLFVYKEVSNIWQNIIKCVKDKESADGPLQCYESQKFKDDAKLSGDYLFQLKYFECFTRTDFSGDQNSNFELNALDI